MKILNFICFIIFGIFIGFILWGFNILPNTNWTWCFGEPIEMSGNISAPVLIRLPSGTYFYILKYEVASKELWYLEEYFIYDSETKCWDTDYLIGCPLSLGINDSYEIIMLPASYNIRIIDVPETDVLYSKKFKASK